jgi:putative membrane protein
MMGGQGFGFGSWGIIGMILNLLFTLLILGGIILLIYWIVKQFTPGGTSLESKNKALEVLKERYAKGEISEKEYKKMKKELTE